MICRYGDSILPLSILLVRWNDDKNIQCKAGKHYRNFQKYQNRKEKSAYKKEKGIVYGTDYDLCRSETPDKISSSPEKSGERKYMFSRLHNLQKEISHFVAHADSDSFLYGRMLY